MGNLSKRFEDFRPYEIPESLDCLAGPSSGKITLPVSVFWQPGSKTLSLNDQDSLIVAYQAILSEGTAKQQCELINKNQLIKIWARLQLPIKVAKLWQEKFSELRGNMRAEWSILINNNKSCEKEQNN